ncbi:MAG: hypothetical protein LBE11_00635 [Prevotellaceae bacterium]|nr:hypothetical protein [Prevotellaceae bacterium]
MTKMYLKITLAVIVASLFITACRSAKTAKTPEQKNAMDRGVLMSSEQCQELAREKVKSWREWGNGVSPKESNAHNIAALDARSRLARQLQVQINTFIRIYNEQYEATGVQDASGKFNEIAEGYAEQLLSGTNEICSNAYVKPDGSFNVYVCIEMSEDSLSRVYKKLTDDQKMSIDYGYERFKQEMEKAMEDYRKNR